MLARTRQSEWMDAPDADNAQLARSLRFIERVNRWLGYTRATLGHLERLTRDWQAGERMSVLDVATGSADVPRAMLQWAARKGIELHVTGVDRHPATLALADQARPDRLELLQGDALALPFADGAFDYVTCSMFLHHLSDEDAVVTLKEMHRVARRGIIVADLLRTRAARFWIWLFTIRANPMVKHDARASVRQAFTADEIRSLCKIAGWNSMSYHRHFAHRSVLVLKKPAAPD